MNYTEADITEALEMLWIDTSSWWQGENKWVDDLLKEIKDRETEIVCNWGWPLRCVKVVTGNVYYTDKEWQLYLLKEEKQTFPNWEEKIRKLTSSISEKAWVDEDNMIAIIRWIQEELSLTSDNIRWVLNDWIETDSRESTAYPWLVSLYTLARFTIILDWDIDVEKWFIEVQKKKTIHFVWIPIEDHEISI